MLKWVFILFVYITEIAFATHWKHITSSYLLIKFHFLPAHFHHSAQESPFPMMFPPFFPAQLTISHLKSSIFPARTPPFPAPGPADAAQLRWLGAGLRPRCGRHRRRVAKSQGDAGHHQAPWMEGISWKWWDTLWWTNIAMENGHL